MLTTTTIELTIGMILFSGIVTGSPYPGKDSLTINIVHTNDMHARFEETSQSSSVCSKQDSQNKTCYGGFARIATLVRKARNLTTPTIFLIAGDTYQGSIFYNVHKWNIVAHFLNILQPNATSLGNHEFDDGIDGLAPFVNNATFPILAANLDLTLEPSLNSSKLTKSTILTINNRTIGIIGYLTPDTQIIASTGKVIFKDEIECIREEAKKLKKRGVNIIIALGHSGFDKDKSIARQVEDVDLVIGGHTNTFLYNGTKPDDENVEGVYPTEIVRPNGKRVYVVQAYAYTKYLGNLTVTFNNEGVVVKIGGNPILVDGKIEQAEDILQELNKFRPKVANMSKEEIGHTRVLIDGDSKRCRREECNFGNILTDAIVDYNAALYAGQGAWTDAAVAVYHGGGIRASISKHHNEKITKGDILQAFPFGDTIYKALMTGQQIISMLEFGVSDLQPNSLSLPGRFLQLSGIQVTYDLTKPNKSKVLSVYIRCASCRVPLYNKLQNNVTYPILISEYMMKGGDGYSMLKNLTRHSLGDTVSQIVETYIKKHSPVHPGIEWRINFYNGTTNTIYHGRTNDRDDLINNKNNKNNKNNNTSSSSANSIFKNHIGLIIILSISSFVLSHKFQ